MKSLLFAFAFVTVLAVSLNGEPMRLKAPYAWARDRETMRMEGEGPYRLTHTGSLDWSFGGFGKVKVRPGDRCRLACRAEVNGDPALLKFNLSAILYDAAGNPLQWVFAPKMFNRPGECENIFIVPFGVAEIEPRLMGNGPMAVSVDQVNFEILGNLLEGREPVAGNNVLRGKGFELTVDQQHGGVTLLDTVTGRKWEPVASPLGVLVASVKLADGKMSVEFMQPSDCSRRVAVFAAEPDKPEFTVTVSGDGEMESSLDYPPAFATAPGDRLIVPMNEGMGFPVEEDHPGLGRLIAYGGHGICMAFFGVVADASGAGWMCILETPDDAAMNGFRDSKKMWTAGPSWDGQKRRFGYDRVARYVLLDKGGHVAMCKRYRDYAKQIGKLKTFTDKVKQRPVLDRLLGAVNIWTWEKDRLGLLGELREAGIDRILWSGDGSEAEVKAMSEMPQVLVGRYDIYQDIYYPEQQRKLGREGPGLNSEAYPHDVNWTGPTSNEWRRAWGVKAKDGSWTYCATMCDRQAVKYERIRVSEELKRKPYNTRFIDTTVASPWMECWNPAHPMTRSDSRHWKMELLRVLGDEFGLVVGSETGHDASVPYCDYYEGMLSVAPYRVPDSGRNIAKIWDEVPDKVAKYQVGERYRLPLWELVYHDCVCAHWYWGDYNNKLPKLWRKRDLFNALYGTVGMFMFNRGQWEQDKDEFVASYKIFSPIARATGYSEMTDHRLLTPDRSVQQTIFADGTEVTVNFGEKPFKLKDGGEIGALDYRVRKHEAR